MIKHVLVLYFFFLFVLCWSDNRNAIDHISLSPGEHRIYSLETDKPMKIGIVLDQAVSGGMVELQQLGSLSKGGTDHHYISRRWTPIEGKIELKLINTSKTKVEVSIFEENNPGK